MAKAEEHGLCFQDTVDIDEEAIIAPISDSFSEMFYGIYRLYCLNRRFYRSIGVKPWINGPNITNNVNETIDKSVYERLRKDKSYRPKNLLEWAKRYNVNLLDIEHSVKADDPFLALPA